MKRYFRLFKEIAAGFLWSFASFKNFCKTAYKNFTDLKDVSLDTKNTMYVTLHKNIVDMATEKNANNFGPKPGDLTRGFNPILEDYLAESAINFQDYLETAQTDALKSMKKGN